MMEKLLIASAATDEEGKKEDYSEWRLWHAGGLRSSFQNVVMNEGFQNRDFQTREGAISVIDPEILGKLRKEASDVRNNMLRCQLAVYVVLCHCVFLFLDSYWLVLVPDDAFFFGLIVTLCVWLILVIVAATYLRKKADTKLTALVEPYQPIFLEKYGIELGYGKFSLSPQGVCSKIHGIYLRRPRRVMEDEEAQDRGHGKDLDGWFPPIYLVRLIPGEIHIDEKEYDANLMKVDAETWALLQSTHQKMIQRHPIVKFLAILLHLGVYVGAFWLGGHDPCGGFISWIVCVVAMIVGKVYEYALDYRDQKVYEEVTKVVNEALQKDEKKAHMAVELHASELPGREWKLCRRYQFVQKTSAPTQSFSSQLVKHYHTP